MSNAVETLAMPDRAAIANRIIRNNKENRILRQIDRQLEKLQDLQDGRVSPKVQAAIDRLRRRHFPVIHADDLQAAGGVQ